LRIAQCLDPTTKSFATQADWNLLMEKLKAQFPSGDHQYPAAAAPPATPSTPPSTPSTAARSASFFERRKAEMRSQRETVIVPTGGGQDTLAQT